MTKKGWIWLAVLIATGVLVTYRGGTVSYLLFYGVLLLPVAAFSYLIYVFFRFRVYQRIDTRQVVKESAVDYEFALTNEDFIAYNHVSVLFRDDYSTAEGLESARPVCLLPGEKWIKNTVLRCHYRGEYQVGIRRIKVRDFLGLFEITYRVSSPLSVRVMPRIQPLTSFVLAEEIDGRREQWMRARRPEVPDAQVREYQTGDPMRQIHWKATARTGQPMSREMTEEPRDVVTLLLQTSHFASKKEAERLEAEDKMIEAVLAVAAYYGRRHATVRVYWRQQHSGVRTMLIRDEKDLNAFYRVCCDLQFHDSVSAMDRVLGHESRSGERELTLLASQAAVTEEPGICYLFAWNDQKNMGEALQILQRAGGRPGAILVGRTAEGMTSAGTLTGNFPTVQIYLGEDVKERLE